MVYLVLIMKQLLPSSLVAAALAFCFQLAGESSVLADWQADFTKSPYQLDQTVIGLEGWVGSEVDSGNNTDAAIVTAPGGSDNVLRVYSTSTNPTTTRRRTFLSNQFTKVEGEKVQVKTSLAFEWTSGTPTSRFMTFALHADSAMSPIIINYGMNEGIFLSGTYGALEADDLQILAANQVKAGAFYDFDIVLDFTAKQFDITVTGTDAYAEPVTWSLKGVPFKTGYQSSLTGVNTVRLLNYQGERLTMYAQEISVASIPEPGSVACLLTGAAAGGLLLLRRRKL